VYTTRKRKGFTLQQLAIVASIIVVAIILLIVFIPAPKPSISEGSYRPYAGTSLEYSDTLKLSFQAYYKRTKEPLYADIFVGESSDSLELVAEKVEGVLSSSADKLFDFNYDIKLDPHGTYWWKVKVYNKKGKFDETENPVSFTFKNSEPSAPSLLTPERGKEVHLDSIVFSWTKAEDADKDNIVYDLYITNDLRGSQTAFSQKDITDNSFELSALDKLDFGQTYYWHVVARDGYGGEVSSVTGNFKTESKPTPVISLLSPVNTEVDASKPVVFSWKQSNERYYWPLKYNFVLKKGTEEVLKKETENTSLTTSVLAGHTEYSWFISAVDKTGKPVESKEATFATINHPPVVKITEPSAGQITTEATLSWEATDLEGDQLTYDIYLISKGMETKVASDLTVTSYILKNLESATDYTFKVVAKDTFGGESSAELAVSSTNNPPVVELLTPAASEIVNPLDVKFSWRAEDPDGDNIINYQLVVIDSEGNETQVPVSSPAYTFEKLRSRTTYSWYVEAIDEKGAKNRSDTLTFVTSNNAPIPAMATLPGNNATDVAFDPGVTIEFVSSDPDNDPLSFEIEISRDSSFTEIVAKKDGEVSAEGITKVLVEGTFETNTTYYWRVITSDGEAFTTSNVWSFSTFDQSPVVSDVKVKEAQEGIVNPVDAAFAWSYSDNDDIVVEAEIHLKPESGDEIVVPAGVNVTEYTLDFVLSPDATYTYWVVVKDPVGKKGTSEAKTFKTGNNPPILSFDFDELNHYGATTPIKFSWEVKDPENSDVFVKVYFGTNKNAWEETPVATGINLNEYIYDGILNPEESYYFWLEAEDVQGNETKLESPVLITPASPRLVYVKPENNSSFDGKTAFSWEYTGETTPVNYTLRVFDEKGQTIFERSTGGENFILAEGLNLLGNRDYRWRVVAEMPDTTKEVGPLYRFKTPDSPTMISSPTPANGMVGVDTKDIVLSWEYEDPDSSNILFDLYLDDTPVITGLATNYATITDYASLESNTTYNWYVVAVDEFDNRATSTIWTFTTLNHSPVVSLLGPLDGATDLTDGIKLSWQGEDPDDEMLYYDVYLGTTEELNDENIVLASATSTSYVFSSYKGNSTYYWKVQVRDEHEGVANSDVWSFSTGNANPKNAIIVNPKPGKSGTSLRPVLEWSGEDPDGDELSYVVYVGETPEVMTKVASTTRTSAELKGILDGNKTYYWKVDSYDGKGGFSESAVASFTTIGILDKVAYVENGALKLTIITEDTQAQTYTLVDSDISDSVKPIVFRNTIYAFKTDGTLIAVKLGLIINEINGDRFNSPEALKNYGEYLYVASASRFGKSIYRLPIQKTGLPGGKIELYRDGKIVSTADLAVSEDATNILVADTLYSLVVLQWNGTGYVDVTPENFADQVKGIANSVKITNGVAYIGITGFGGGIAYVSLDDLETLKSVDGYYLATDMVLVEDLLYAATDKGLSIISVDDPMNPVVISDVKISGRILGITAGEKGKFLMISTNQGTRFFDVQSGKIM